MDYRYTLSIELFFSVYHGANSIRRTPGGVGGGGSSTLPLISSQVDLDVKVNLSRETTAPFATCSKCNEGVLKRVLEVHERFCSGMEGRQGTQAALSATPLARVSDARSSPPSLAQCGFRVDLYNPIALQVRRWNYDQIA